MNSQLLYRNVRILLALSMFFVLAGCGSSDEEPPEPQTDQTMLQATVETVNASSTADETSQPASASVRSLGEQLIGEWRVIDTYEDGCISRRSGQWSTCGPYDNGTVGLLKALVFAADERFYDATSETYGTYRIVEEERQLLLQFPDWSETWNVIDISEDTLSLLYEDDPLDQAIDFVRYGAGPVDAEQLAGLWSFEPNGLSGIEWRILFYDQDNFLAWADTDDGFMIWSGKYEHFTDDVLILPGAPWEDDLNGPPTLHVEALDGNRGHFSFPEVEVETGFDVTRVREDEELARQLEGHWLFLDGEDQYEVELSTTFMSTVIGTFSEIEYTLRTFEDGTIGWFNNDDPGVLLCSTEFTGSAEITLECPANHPDAWQILLRRPG